MKTVSERERVRKVIRMLILGFLWPIVVVAALYTIFFYDLTVGFRSRSFPSPNARMVARVVHSWGDTSEIRIETNGIHPLRLGSSDLYDYADKDGWVAGLKWRDDRTLIVTFCFHNRHPSLPQRHWRGVTVLFQEDACGKAPL